MAISRPFSYWESHRLGFTLCVERDARMDGRNDHISFLKGIREWHRLRISSAVCNLIASRLRLIRLSALCPYAHTDSGRAKWLMREKAGAEQHEESRTPAKSPGNQTEHSTYTKAVDSHLNQPRLTLCFRMPCPSADPGTGLRFAPSLGGFARRLLETRTSASRRTNPCERPLTTTSGIKGTRR